MKKRIKDFFKEFMRIIAMPEMRILPGQLAFYFVLAIVPTLSLVSYMASFLNLSANSIYNFLASAFSKDLANLLISNDIASPGSGGIKFLIVLVIAYYISSNGCNSIILTSDTIYGVESKSFLYRRLKALVMTIILLFLIVFILLVPIFGDKLVYFITYLDVSQKFTEIFTTVITYLQSPVSWFIIFIIIKLIYTMAPDRKVESRKVNYGAIFTTVCWVIGTYWYSFYINNLAHYNAYYGALANLIVLMLWFYYLAFIFTVGMALNYHKEEEENEKTAALKIVNGE